MESPGLAYWFGLALGSTVGFPVALNDHHALFAGVCASISLGAIMTVVFVATYRGVAADRLMPEGGLAHATGCGVGSAAFLSLLLVLPRLDLPAVRELIPMGFFVTSLALPALLGRTTGFYVRGKSPTP